MPGQVIGTVNVQVNQQQGGTVRQLNYGVRTINLSMTGATDSDVIVYQANTNSFVVKSVGEIAPDLDAGFF
jgi:hypothetical protein